MNFSLKSEIARLPDPAHLATWFDTALGRELLQCELRHLGPYLTRVRGYHLAYLGSSTLPLQTFSPINHHFAINSGLEGVPASVLAEQEALPLSGETIDLMILHHAIEFSSNPHQLLREVSRVLIAGGQLVICGFNPLSIWGLRRLFSFGKGKGPWQANMMTCHRLCDWLKLLELKVCSVQYGAYCWPVNSARWIRYSSIFDKPASKLNWPTGGFYMITARKQIAPLTPSAKKQKGVAQVPVGIPVVENISSAARETARRNTNRHNE